MIDGTLTVERLTLEVINGDEIDKLIEGLDEINRVKEQSSGRMLYTAEKEVRDDPVLGKYSILVVYKFGMDPADPTRPIRFQEITPVDAEGNILQEAAQKIKRASIVLQSKGLQRYQERRGMKLKAASMHSNVKFKFEGDEDV